MNSDATLFPASYSDETRSATSSGRGPLTPALPPFSLASSSLKLLGVTRRRSFKRGCQSAAFSSLWWVRVAKTRRPLSPAALLLARNGMIKGGSFQIRERGRQQRYCTFKGAGGDATSRDDSNGTLICERCLPLLGEIRGCSGGCVCALRCCSEWSDQRGGGGVMADRLAPMCQCVSHVLFSFIYLSIFGFVKLLLIVLWCFFFWTVSAWIVEKKKYHWPTKEPVFDISITLAIWATHIKRFTATFLQCRTYKAFHPLFPT